MFGKKKDTNNKIDNKKNKKKQKEKKQKEKYVELRGLLGVGKDYHVYHMKLPDYLISWLLGGDCRIRCSSGFFQ